MDGVLLWLTVAMLIQHTIVTRALPLDINRMKKSMCVGWQGPLDACYINYNKGDVIELPCTTDPTASVDWLTCTGCARPFNLTGQDRLNLPNTSVEILNSAINSNTLKLLVEESQAMIITLMCYARGQTNILGISYLASKPQSPGHFLRSQNSQVCPLVDNLDLTLSCRAGCFDPDRCTKNWTRDNELVSTETDINIHVPGTYACSDANNDVIMTFEVPSTNGHRNTTQFCSYQEKPTTPVATESAVRRGPLLTKIMTSHAATRDPTTELRPTELTQTTGTPKDDTITSSNLEVVSGGRSQHADNRIDDSVEPNSTSSVFVWVPVLVVVVVALLVVMGVVVYVNKRRRGHNQVPEETPMNGRTATPQYAPNENQSEPNANTLLRDDEQR